MHPSDFSSSKQGRPISSYLDCNDSVDGNALGTWYEDLEEYEDNLEKMATANLDQSFQDELQHVNQWFGFLSDAEKTATIYALLQHSSQVQIKFFIRMLQEMRKSNPLNREKASERASTLMNLSNRRLSSINQQQNRNASSRHSFALGDTQELSRIFDSSNKKWLDSEEPHHPSPPQPRTTISVPRASSRLRPRSVIELNHAPSSFSNSWLRQPNVFNSAGVTENYRPIERPRSADITSWHLPSSTNTSATWQTLSSPHDINAQSHWKNNNNWIHVQQPQPTTSSGLFHYFDKPKSSSSPTTTSAGVRFNDEYNQFLGPSKPNLDHKKNHGYGSDPGNNSSAKYGSRLSSVQNTSNHHQSLSHPKTRSTHLEPSAKEEAVDMELLEDVTAWFRSMRLHKYNTIFEKMRWQDIVKLNDQELQDIGVAALGARRKMLKVFENIQEHCKSHHVDF
ncbi:hypothetical protein A0J61_07348 [Choanephora cucurbitarum]|uniref:SAM domain-containing protein n=1 Tax=Choanephora cucurbitarum TaxID=101091 RepID=A0A1C7N7K0_9FUNG|nr:hypothetical protein A0J61_07348 [Choanephora cucurbitarum]